MNEKTDDHISKVLEFMGSEFNDRYSVEIRRGADQILALEDFLIPEDYRFEDLKRWIRYAHDPTRQRPMKDITLCCVVEKKTNYIIGFGTLQRKVSTNFDKEGNSHYLSELRYIFVAEEHRRRGAPVGVSDVIVKYIIDETTEPACKASPNESAKGLLMRHGFIDGRIYIKDERFHYWGREH